MRGHGDLRIAAWLAVLCTGLGLAVPLTGLSLLFVAPLALALPGYAITSATFARRELEWPQRLLLSISLSLAVLVLGSLLLNYVPGGIRALSWSLLLLGAVLGGCRIAALRRPARAAPRRPPLPRLRGRDATMLAAGMAAVATALVLSASSPPAPSAAGYTQLWILSTPGSGGTEAQVGVRSEEQQPVAYDLRVKIGPATPTPEIVRRSFTLKPGESRTVAVGPPAARPGSRVPVTATLLRHNRPFSVYRRVRGWLVAPEGRR